MAFAMILALDLIGHGPLAQRKDLKAATIGEKRTVPVHKFMQSSHFFDEVRAGLKHQMVGVGKDNISLRLNHLGWGQCLDRSFGTAKDVIGGFDCAVRGFEQTQPRPRFLIAVGDVEGEVGVSESHGVVIPTRFRFHKLW